MSEPQKIVGLIERSVAGLSDDLSGGLVSEAEFRYHLGIIRGLREAIGIIKDFEASQFEDDEEWNSSPGDSPG